MKLSQRLKDEREFVERSLGNLVICGNCNATLRTFADVCTAGLQDQCPGYLAIENAKTEFTEMPSVDEQMAQLRAAGWIPLTPKCWKAPVGSGCAGCFLGPHGAWKAMKRREATQSTPESQIK